MDRPARGWTRPANAARRIIVDVLFLTATTRLDVWRRIRFPAPARSDLVPVNQCNPEGTWPVDNRHPTTYLQH